MDVDVFHGMVVHHLSFKDSFYNINTNFNASLFRNLILLLSSNSKF